MIWQLHAVAGLGVHPMNTPFAHLDRSIHQLRRRSAASRHSTPRPGIPRTRYCSHPRTAIATEGVPSASKVWPRSTRPFWFPGGREFSPEAVRKARAIDNEEET